MIGAGVTGAACALRLREHGIGAALLDARTAAAGASGRNGGFASAGTAMGASDMIAALGLEQAREVHRFTERTLDSMLALAEELGDAGAVRRSGSLWLVDGGVDATAALAATSAIGAECHRADELIPAPMRAHHQTAVHCPRDCTLDPARWTRALTLAASRRGAHVHERTEARELTATASGHVVGTSGGRVEAGAVVLACDGLLTRLAPELNGIVYPVRGQMLATEPLADTVVDMPTHSDHGFFYYRPTSDGRLAIGGGRLEALEDEYTDREHPTPPVQAAIERFVADRLGIQDPPVAYRWAGTMGFSADLLPLAGELPGRPGVYVAGGYSGKGNVQGFGCGRLVADAIAGRRPPFDAFEPARFAAGGLLQAPPERREQVESRALLAAR